jgi:hypothetical protein
VSQEQKVFWIKTVHSLLFGLFSFCVAFAAYSAVTGVITGWTWSAVLLVLIEGLVLISRNWVCPLTDLAERYGSENGGITHLFMPKWLSDYVFQIWGVIFVVSVLVIIGRVTL